MKREKKDFDSVKLSKKLCQIRILGGKLRKIRIRDIARKANVSEATVSNALNGRKGVSLEIAQKVKEIAEKMGYEKSRTGSNQREYIRLIVFKCHGLVVMDTQFFAELSEAIENECHHNNTDLMVTHIDMSQDLNCLERIKAISSEKCAGILLLATEMSDKEIGLFDKVQSNLLILDSIAPNLSYNAVVMNNREAGYLATEKLITSGHKRIGHISSSPDFYNMKYRREGFLTCMASNNLPVDENDILALTPTLDGSYSDMCKWLDSHKKVLPTAFFAANDILAVGVVRAMQERNIRIPQDVSIIGMDDMQICLITNPQLSTIKVPRTDMAKVAVRRLLEISEEDAPKSILKTEVGVTLIDRQSVMKLVS